MNETAAFIVIGLGLAFDVFGCVGLFRLPDVYTRLQASTKCVTLGTCLILFGVFLYSGFSAMGGKAIICLVFVLITLPTGAHALARGAYKYGIGMRKPYLLDKYGEVEDEEMHKR